MNKVQTFYENRKERILKEASSGMPIVKIAAKWGITPGRVYQIIDGTNWRASAYQAPVTSEAVADVEPVGEWKPEQAQ